MVFDSWMTKRLVTLLSVPNGVLAMEENAPDLVQFSRNLGVIHSEQQGIKVTFSSRSAKNEQIDASLTELDAYALHTQAEITHHSRYPGWEIAERSELREKYAEIFSGLFGRELRIASIHAGLDLLRSEDRKSSVSRRAIGSSFPRTIFPFNYRGAQKDIIKQPIRTFRIGCCFFI